MRPDIGAEDLFFLEVHATTVAPAAFRHSAGRTLICFSHLRWEFVFQRPQHLMTRFAAAGRQVVVWEEPVGAAEGAADLHVRELDGVTVVTPRLPEGLSPDAADAEVARLLEGFVAERGIEAPVAWFYTPMMLGFARAIAEQAACVVYDCMDELSNFKDAPPLLRAREAELLELADVVFTGGWSLYEAKRDRHDNIHPFPSSVDGAHFASARQAGRVAPADQAAIPHPRLGYYGVIDERMDLDLLGAVAAARPDWHLVMVGPVVKVDVAA